MARRRAVYALMVGGFARVAICTPLPDSAQEALMEVTINGERQADWTLIELTPDGAAWVRREELKNWGVQIATDSPLALLAPDAFIRLNDVPGVHGTVNRADSSLAVDVQPALLMSHAYTTGRAEPRARGSPLAAFVNYDLGAGQSRGPALLRANAEAGIVRGNWVARTAWFATAQGGRNDSVRLDANVTADFPATRSSMQWGDTFARLGSNGDAVRIGGLAWGTDFSVTPTFITVPLPTVNTLTSNSGTVDLYVNGAKTQQLNVPGGPSVLTQVPVTTGAGELTVVTHDLAGRTQTVTQSYYIAPQMLQAGLRAWDVQVGAKRLAYGAVSNDYRGWLAAVGERYGASSRLTTQWRFEGDETGGAVSGQLLALAPNDALVTAGSSCSDVSSRTGCLFNLAYDREHRLTGYGLDLSVATHEYRPVATDLRALTQRWQIFGHAQAVAPLGLSVTLGAIWRENSTGTHTVALNLAAGKTFARTGHLDLNVSRLSGDTRSTFVTLIYTQSIGRDHNVSVDAYSNDGRVGNALTVQRNLPAGNGYGYTLRAARDTVTDAEASGQWNGDALSVAAFAQHQGAASLTGIDITGAALWMGGEVLPARRLSQSFALVRAPGLEGLPVYLNEQPVTRIGHRGVAVLPDLLPFQSNKVAVDPTAVPMSLDVPTVHFDVTPYRRGGAIIDVPVHLATTIRLRLANGDVVPSGARVHGMGRTVPVADDGMAYVEGMEGANDLRVDWNGGHCRARLQLPVSADVAAEGVVLTCVDD